MVGKFDDYNEGLAGLRVDPHAQTSPRGLGSRMLWRGVGRYLTENFERGLHGAVTNPPHEAEFSALGECRERVLGLSRSRKGQSGAISVLAKVADIQQGLFKVIAQRRETVTNVKSRSMTSFPCKKGVDCPPDPDQQRDASMFIV